MNSKNAALFAFIGTMLVSVLMVWNLVSDIMNVSQGLVPAAKLLSSLIYSIGWLSLTLFFFMFQKDR